MRDANGVGITGGRGAAPIWADFMIKATDGEPHREFSVPSDIHFETVDPVSGEIAGQWTQNPVQVALRSGETAAAPDKSSTMKADKPSLEETNRPAVEEGQKSTIIKADESAIKEEDLPPE
jgi:membrane carboxypeptidase/penicillin-binding protein